MMTYEFKLYSTKRTKHLDAMLREAAYVWNRALALQRRYYALTGKYISCARMKSHFARRLRRRLLHSQTVQEILERQDASYDRFFKRLAKRPPKFRKASRFRSFVFKQGGYKLYGNEFIVNRTSKRFHFSYPRPVEGKPKQVRVLRTPLGEYRLCVVTDAVAKPFGKTHDGASVGMDFGLEVFLTLSDGTRIDAPLFLKRDLGALRKASRRLSRAAKHSSNWYRRKAELDRIHERIVNRRNDWQWKLAHDLCRRHDVICVEDLDMRGMSRLWGRKVHDLAFGLFIPKLAHVASKYGVVVHKVDRFYASSKTCSSCGFVNKELSLRDRVWTCPCCGSVLDRDLNAACNIHRQGIAGPGSTRKTRVAG